MNPPIQITLGTGKVGVSIFTDEDGLGLIFQDTGIVHPIGSFVPPSELKEHTPRDGEIYLKCLNRKSALVLMEQVCRLVSKFTDDEVAKSKKRAE